MRPAAASADSGDPARLAEPESVAYIEPAVRAGWMVSTADGTARTTVPSALPDNAIGVPTDVVNTPSGAVVTAGYHDVIDVFGTWFTVVSPTGDVAPSVHLGVAVSHDPWQPTSGSPHLDATAAADQVTYPTGFRIDTAGTYSLVPAVGAARSDGSGGPKFTKVVGANEPSVAGTHMVAVDGARVMRADVPAGGPVALTTGDISPWFDAAPFMSADWLLQGAVASDDGRVVALHYVTRERSTTYGPPAAAAIRLLGTSGFAGSATTLGPLDCLLPTAGIPQSQPSVSADGSMIAWQDDRGLLVAPTPTTAGGGACVLTAAPTVISPTGREPDFGRYPVPGGSTVTVVPDATTTVSRPIRLTLTRSRNPAVVARQGVRVRLAPVPQGSHTLTLTVPARALGGKTSRPVVIARTTARGATATIRPKPAVRARLARLRAVTLTVAVRAAGTTTRAS